jgi:hypothetical protein
MAIPKTVDDPVDEAAAFRFAGLSPDSQVLTADRCSGVSEPA